jgi:uncharacterized protein
MPQQNEPFVHVAETHSGVVFAVGDRVYKAKKPVDLGFLDFSSVGQRRSVCHREVELNRRLAPDVYLGVADVHDPDGEVSEHLVVMRRMPAHRALDSLAEGGTDPGEHVEDRVEEVAEVLARFHATARRSSEIDEEAVPSSLRRRWRANLDDLAAFAAGPLDEDALDQVDRRAMSFVDDHESLFAQRIAEGRIVDGHGDLLASDVFCLADGPRLLDCVEFDDRLRYADGLDDAAGLVMDLTGRGHPELAEVFLRRYCERTGDPAPAPLVGFYVASRALIRAKAACLRHSQSEDDRARDVAGREARRLIEMAAARLRSGPRLILVGGPPGSGKSTLAAWIAERLGARVISSDPVRKELAGLAPDAATPAERSDELYSDAHTDRTYTTLLQRAATALERGATVVLDASWTRSHHREQAAQIAKGVQADMVALRCVADRATAVERSRTRRSGASDAGPAVAEHLAATADPWPDAVEIDTRDSPEQALDRAMPHLTWSP